MARVRELMSIRGVAAIVGIAERAPQRWSEGLTTLELWGDVAVRAIRDSGLNYRDVDGLIVTPIGGFSGFIPATTAEFLSIQPTFAEVVDLGGATAAGMISRAAAAIHAGMCTTCLCITGALRRKKDFQPGDESKTLQDRSPHVEFDYPYGMIGANVGYGLLAARYAHDYQLSDAQRVKIAVDQRINANMNPDAIFHDTTLTTNDVLASPVICEPLHLLEMVMPTAGAAALLVTSADRAMDACHAPAWILGAGEAVTHASFAQAPVLDQTGIGIAARAAFSQAGVTPADIGLASLYDCYTIMVLLTLEEAGFCARGEAGNFVESHDLTYAGDFPINTHGGQLSYGQSGLAGGASHITEAVRQLQGRGHQRQIRDLELAYITGNGGIVAEQTSLILGADK